MSEQLANSLIEREERGETGRTASRKGDQADGFFVGGADADTAPSKDVSDCADDFLIAQMLQVQFDQVRKMTLIVSWEGFLKVEHYFRNITKH